MNEHDVTRARRLASMEEATHAISHIARACIQGSMADPMVLGQAAVSLEQAAARLMGEDMTDFSPRKFLKERNFNLQSEVAAQFKALQAKDEFCEAQAAEISRLQETVRALSPPNRTMIG